MSLPRILSLTLLPALFLNDAAQSAELLPPDRPVSEVIDHYVGLRLETVGVAPMPSASQPTLLRRTTLDLAGRIPTAVEARWFSEQPEDQRRTELVDRLLQLPDFAFHRRNELDALLLYNKPYDNEFRDYLLWAARENRSWAVMFRDMLLAEEAEGPLKGAAQFLKSRIREVEDLTNDTAVLFFGVNISCAKCHDHPLVEDWKQDHFYGMQSFFSRTYQTKKNTVAENLFDEVKFKTTSGDEKTAAYMFLTGDVVPDETPQFSDEEKKAIEAKIRDARQKDDGEIPVPTFSPRQRLIDVALNDDRDHFFSRNIVNRIWLRLLGTGLVNPADQMHSGNPPSHPELLDWLARDLRQHGYEIRRLIRGIVLSDTYARSSEWQSGSETPSDSLFAVAKPRPLTPSQLALALQVAGRSPAAWPELQADAEWMKLREGLENQIGGWVREFEPPSEGFQVAVDEALFFSNNARINDDILRDSGDRIVGHLNTLEDDPQLINTLWSTALCRPPTEEEKSAAIAWLSRDGDRIAMIRQLSWALLAGPEFRFNH